MSGATTLEAAERRLLDEARSRDAAMREDLAAWVAIPTGRGHADGVERFRELLTGRLARLGASRRDVEGDPRPAWLPADAAAAAGPIPATSLLERPGEGVRFLLAGHLDTVHDPGGAFQRLEPIGGDRATGPGAADMKGGLLVATVALELLDAIGEPVAWTFALNADEETGSFHSARALEDVARRHDVGLVFEPALPGGALAIERMGAGQFRIDCHGRAAHVGRDFAHGVSAVTALAKCLVRIAELPDAERGLVANVGPISGGAATNIVPDRAVAWGNVRFRDEAGAVQLGRAIEALATEAGAMPEVRVEFLANRPAKPCTPAVESLAREAREIASAIGVELPFASTGGVCDGNILQSAGLPTLDNLGVRGGNLHRLDEFVDLDSLTERAALAAILIRRLRRRR
ncbi:MAG: M20/M25/M40 family metallo-hydrolase [Phycisphaerales bacterium]